MAIARCTGGGNPDCEGTTEDGRGDGDPMATRSGDVVGPTENHRACGSNDRHQQRAPTRAARGDQRREHEKRDQNDGIGRPVDDDQHRTRAEACGNVPTPEVPVH